MTQHAKKYLTVKEAAFEASISIGFLYKLWRLRKGPPTILLGRKRLVPAESLTAWLQGLSKQ